MGHRQHCWVSCPTAVKDTCHRKFKEFKAKVRQPEKINNVVYTGCKCTYVYVHENDCPSTCQLIRGQDPLKITSRDWTNIAWFSWKTRCNWLPALWEWELLHSPLFDRCLDSINRVVVLRSCHQDIASWLSPAIPPLQFHGRRWQLMWNFNTNIWHNSYLFALSSRALMYVCMFTRWHDLRASVVLITIYDNGGKSFFMHMYVVLGRT